jgi:MFS superfamily sulfate permease-like transporter
LRAGVFWMARVDRIDDASATALRDRVRSKSPRRTIVLAVHTAMMVAIGVGLVASLPLALGAFALSLGFDALLRRRVIALRRDVDAWKTQLG